MQESTDVCVAVLQDDAQLKVRSVETLSKEASCKRVLETWNYAH